MQKVNIDIAAEDLQKALGISEDRAEDMDTLCGIIVEELNSGADEQREVSNLDFLSAFLKMARTEAERVYLAYMAGITVTEQFPA